MSPSELDLDWDAIVQETVAFIKRIATEAGADGVVLGLSGGVDSSLVATLFVRALGKEKVLGVLLPTDFMPAQDIQDAEKLARLLGIRTEHIMITPVITSFARTLGLEVDHSATDEISIDYDRLDRAERMLFDDKLSPQEVARKTQVNIEIVLDVLERYRSSAHKRCYPPTVREW